MGFYESSPTFLTSSPQCSEMCTHSDDDCAFQVAWSINPHMKIGSADSGLAVMQHRRFISALRKAGAEVIEVPFLHGEFDSVFAKDNAVLFEGDTGRVAMLAKPSTRERSSEQESRSQALEEVGIDVITQAKESLEGGDVVFVESKAKIFFGYGQRSSLAAAVELREYSGCEVVALELVDPFFFHLDTALNFVEVNGRQVAFAYRGAFSDEAWRTLICDRDVAAVVEVEREEALGFALNWVEVNGTVILGSEPKLVVQRLRSLGKNVVVTPLDQFQLAGGSAACLATKIHFADSIFSNHTDVLREHFEPLARLDS